jgi:hypothetical protein
MNKLSLLSGIILLFLSACVNKPTSFWDDSAAYLGQKPPADTPRVFAPGLLADTGIALDRVAFSPDGKEFYYCYNTTWFSFKDLKIKYFRYVDGAWKGPLVLNEGFNSPTFSVDGNTLYFPGGDSLGGILWQSKRSGDKWSKPSVYFREKYSLYDLMPTTSGNMYIGTNGDWGKADDYSSYDIGVINVTGRDTALQNLGSPLNTKNAFDGDFFVAKDESYIIISTKETKDFECELHISFRKPDKTWGAPQSLGPLINNGVAHRWGQYVTPDGKFLFYTQGTSEKDCHIYWVRFDRLLKDLKQKSQ